MVILDSKGSLDKLLIHQTYYYYNRFQEQISLGLIDDVLNKLNNINCYPELFVIRSYRNEKEKQFLIDESEKWKEKTKNMHTYDYLKKNELDLPYAQDIGIVGAKNMEFYLSNSPRIPSEFKSFTSKVLEDIGYKVYSPKEKNNLEGGYVFSSSEVTFYSNSSDNEIINSIYNNTIYVKSLLSEIIRKRIKFPKPRGKTTSSPDHVDLLLSSIEIGDIIHFFILDVEKYVFLDQSINIKEKIYLKQVFSEYQKEIELLKKKIKVIYPKATFSFIPGIIGSENVPQGKMFFVYSGLNYLYHEKDNKTYALFMKYPSSYIRKDINSEIKQTLKSRSIEPIEVSCRNEFYNFFFIKNSAGLRCTFKKI